MWDKKRVDVIAKEVYVFYSYHSRPTINSRSQRSYRTNRFYVGFLLGLEGGAFVSNSSRTPFLKCRTVTFQHRFFY